MFDVFKKIKGWYSKITKPVGYNVYKASKAKTLKSKIKSDKYDTSELIKLAEMLDADGIHYNFVICEEEKFKYYQIHSLLMFDSYTYIWDAVIGEGTYGAEDGLLEVFGYDLDDVIGWLPADEAYEKIKVCICNYLRKNGKHGYKRGWSTWI